MEYNQTDMVRQKYFLQYKQTFINIDVFAKSYKKNMKQVKNSRPYLK